MRHLLPCLALALVSAGCSREDDTRISYCALSNHLAGSGPDVPEEMTIAPNGFIQVGDSINITTLVETDIAIGILDTYEIVLPKGGRFADGTTAFSIGGRDFDVAPLASGNMWVITSRNWKPSGHFGDQMRTSVLYSSRLGVLAIQTAFRTASGEAHSVERAPCTSTSKRLMEFSRN